MPTFFDPQADAREAAQAVRGLAHATQHIEDPEVLYPVIGELMATTRNLSQVLAQVARAHQQHTGRAVTDAGDRQAGSRLAFEAAAALHEAADHVRETDGVLDLASNRAARIAWQPDTPQERWASIVFLQGEEAEPVLEMLDRQGPEAAIAYLAGWDYGEETVSDAMENGYVYDAPPESAADRVTVDGNYALTASSSLTYVGLTRRVTLDAEDQLPREVTVAAVVPEQQARHREPQRAEPPWFRPDAITEVTDSRGLSL